MRGDSIFFADAKELGRWFAQNGATCTEVVVGFIKTHTGRAGLTWPQAVDEALCVLAGSMAFASVSMPSDTRSGSHPARQVQDGAPSTLTESRPCRPKAA